jgi:hypothetical protein
LTKAKRTFKARSVFHGVGTLIEELRIMKTRIAIRMALFMAVVLSVASATELPYGTRVTVRLGNRLSSATAHSGQTFDATVARDVVVNGKTIVKAGSPAKGKVTYAKSSGRLHKPGVVTIRLTSVDGNRVTTTAVSAKGKSHTKSNVTKIGGGAAAGALIGGLAGGGKGALIGAGAGTAAGTGVAAATGKEEVVMSSESVRVFTITSGKPRR